MKMYQLKGTQKLHISMEEAWKFLSDPKNLKTITPDYMGFDIVSGSTGEMFEGQIIQYIVTPVAGIKTKWVTEITHIKDKTYFVDEQRFGPYALWHHKHFIEEIEGGVLMTDIVDYKLPAGIIGQLVHPFLVKPKLREIFSYRAEKLKAIYGELQESATTLEFNSF
ncbi:Ligand-binding SRPBCC domain-containing protein [Pustulibacterium marinum]|uniref:Ligand-binding SRPBCC domain-containing protein n=1 Tax=Pustulibacterium marinum TaxID=1224947 RepID=A0A1I7HZZ3_9FLAO|nr:SRPBCC family protein [Pustulibacterium marinum]SFU66259.1 Ligand-binding SRPBCC domain-containing protein [Pustulibacterium marinum]